MHIIRSPFVIYNAGTVVDYRLVRQWRVKIGVEPLTAHEIGIASTGETPLWYYILREADVCTGGHRLGPVDDTIVTEVLVGLIDADPTSFRHHNPEWHPNKTLIELLAS